MRLNLKPFKLLCVLALACVCLPANAETQKEPFTQRVITDGNETAFMNFPSKHVAARHVRFVLPEGYTASVKRYPVVYVLGESDHKNIVKPADAVFVFITPHETDKNISDFVKFLQEDLMPYTDVNYRTIDEPRYRMLAARGAAGAYLLEVYSAQRQINNLAFIDAKSVPLPSLKAKGRVWLSGAKADVGAIVWQLPARGYVYGANMLYSFDTGNTFASIPVKQIFTLNADYLSDFKLSLTADFKAIPMSYEEGVELTANLKTKNGLNVNCLLTKANISYAPQLEIPALVFDEASQAVFVNSYYVINTPKKRSVTLKAQVMGKNAKTKLKLY
ncbi:hypothetical protein AAIR98_000658 [Elusimicrobium simillimum]|uniref:hypothetical protein n=1 Tax=Elusimicrobium simillimum TaxID=3143438 RepID=UPI003C6F5CFB